MDEIMAVDFDNIKKLSTKEQVCMLKEIKNQLIGSPETKQAYFDRGLIEVVTPMLEDACDQELCCEALMIINSFTIDFSPA